MGESKPICLTCSAELEIDDIGIKCPQYHNLCHDCSKHYIEGIFEKFPIDLPPKCLECMIEIPPLIFKNQLSPEFLFQYIEWINKTKNEELKRCPKCNRFGTWNPSFTANLFTCKIPSCRATTCILCNKSFKMPDDEEFSNRYNYEEEEELEKEYQTMLMEGYFYHQLCDELYPFKKKIDLAIEEGEKRRCPECGLAGRIDENCTHMTCSVCQTVWCYFCGKKESDYDKDYQRDKMLSHNLDWKTNELRCPMLFTDINEIDERWPKNGEDCLNYFHRLLTLKSLKQTINEIGLNNYYKISDHFSSIKNNGYDIDEIMNFEEIPVIDRTDAYKFSEDNSY